MSLLRRIVVVSKKSQIHAIAQELAHEVFAADDLAEAGEIVATVSSRPGGVRRRFRPGPAAACLARRSRDRLDSAPRRS